MNSIKSRTKKFKCTSQAETLTNGSQTLTWKDTNKWKNIHFLTEITYKMTTLQKTRQRYNATTLKIPKEITFKVHKLTLKFTSLH